MLTGHHDLKIAKFQVKVWGLGLSLGFRVQSLMVQLGFRVKGLSALNL